MQQGNNYDDDGEVYLDDMPVDGSHKKPESDIKNDVSKDDDNEAEDSACCVCERYRYSTHK